MKETVGEDLMFLKLLSKSSKYLVMFVAINIQECQVFMKNAICTTLQEPNSIRDKKWVGSS